MDILIRRNGTKGWWVPELFEQKTRRQLPRELAVLAPPLPEKKNYNCFIYTLGLSNNQRVVNDSRGFIYSRFMKNLLDKSILSRTENPRPGDYIFYQNVTEYPDEITHSGIIQSNGKIVSKWAWGPLIEHAILDVSASYGNIFYYVTKTRPEEAEEFYWNFKNWNTKPSG